MSSETRKAKASRDAKKKQQRQLYILVGIVAGVVIAILAIISISLLQPNPDEIVAEAAATYSSLNATVTEDGVFRLGDPDAPLVITDYSSFGCGHCRNFHNDQFQRLLPFIEEGTVSFVYVPVTNQFAFPASAASFCAAEEGKFWEMHDILFDYLGQYGNSAFQIDRLLSAAEALDMDTGAFEACLSSEEVIAQIDAANTLYFTLVDESPVEVTGTPTITFNGNVPSFGSGSPPWELIAEQIAAATA